MNGFSITYIYHDCFIIETGEAVFIFDYWKDPLSGIENRDFPPLLEEINSGKPVYVLVSHHHKDHFSRRIFLWSQRIENIRYIVSRDVYKAVNYLFREDGNYKGFRPDSSRLTVMTAGDIFSDGIVKISAFPSTDIGNSYVVENAGYTFFHAGDLNAWILDEYDAEEKQQKKTEYQSIIDTIASRHHGFDAVMFPVDSRIGGDFSWGARVFVNRISCKLFIPMHFELVMEENQKEQRRKDAASFQLYARKDYGDYLQLAQTRSVVYRS